VTQSKFHIYERKPQAVICHNPGKFTFTSTVGKDIPSDNTPLPVPEGTLLRFGRMLGKVVNKRVYTDAIVWGAGVTPLHANSVMVQCVASIDRFEELDLTVEHVWPMTMCQVLEGRLARTAKEDPKKFLELFCRIETESMPTRKIPVRKRDT